MNVYVTHLATFLPNAPVSNDDIEKVLGRVNDQPSMARARVLRNNGIKQRHYAIDPETGKATHDNAQLTAEVVRALASQAGLSVHDLGLLAVGTASPDQLIPAHGSMVHGELGGPPLEVFTSAGACCASMGALKFAAMAVASGHSRRAVVTGSELMSPLMRASHFGPELASRLQALEADPHLAFEHEFLRWMLSDGAGACLLEPTPRENSPLPQLKIEWVESLSFAGELQTCMVHLARLQGERAVGWKQVEPAEWLKGGFFNVGQDARQLARHIGPFMGDALQKVLSTKALEADQVDWLLPHISSNFFRGEISRQLQRIGFPVPDERVFTNLATVGNVGTASVFMMLDELIRSGRAQRGQKILCVIPESARFAAAFSLLTVC